MGEDQARVQAIEEESLILAEFVRTQRQMMDQLARHVREVCTAAREAREKSRRLKAEIAERRSRSGRSTP